MVVQHKVAIYGGSTQGDSTWGFKIRWIYRGFNTRWIYMVFKHKVTDWL